MHDPLVVAFEIPSPLVHRCKWRDAREGQKRWTFGRVRRTNPENLGEPVYGWWRARGWNPKIAGRAYQFGRVATVWHVEPKGRDSGEVCKHYRRWKDDAGRWHSKSLRAWRWHVWHWRIQVHLAGRLKRFLFERCIRCGHRYPWGYAPVSHQWDGPKSKWFKVQKHAYHHECSALGSREQQVEQLEMVIRDLFGYYRTAMDLSEEDAVDALCGHSSPWPFHTHYRVQGLLGWERDDKYRLVRSADVKARKEAEREQRRAARS